MDRFCVGDGFVLECARDEVELKFMVCEVVEIGTDMEELRSEPIRRVLDETRLLISKDCTKVWVISTSASAVD